MVAIAYIEVSYISLPNRGLFVIKASSSNNIDIYFLLSYKKPFWQKFNGTILFPEFRW